MATRLIATVELTDASGKPHFASQFERVALSEISPESPACGDSCYWQMRDGRPLSSDDEWTFQDPNGNTFDLKR